MRDRPVAADEDVQGGARRHNLAGVQTPARSDPARMRASARMSVPMDVRTHRAPVPDGAEFVDCGALRSQVDQRNAGHALQLRNEVVEGAPTCARG